MTAAPEVIPLLYRADWTRWSVGAEVTVRQNRSAARAFTSRFASELQRGWGGMMPLYRDTQPDADAGGPDPGLDQRVQIRYRFLIAPGGRFRFEPLPGLAAGEPAEHGDEPVTLIVCDGESCWVIRGEEAEQYAADRWHAPMDDVVSPSRLISRLHLAAAGTTEQAGRAVLRLTGKPRLPNGRSALRTAMLDQVDLLVDAELGLVLRQESRYDGQPLEITELRDLVVEPRAASDPACFRLPPGIDDHDMRGFGPPDLGLIRPGGPDGGTGWHESGPGSIAAVLGAAAVRAVARRLARPEPPRGAGADPDAVMPAAEDAEPAAHEAVADDLLNLIARTGLPPLNLSAEVHHWVDAEVAAPWIHAAIARSFEAPVLLGFLGSDSPRAGLLDLHRAALLRLAMPGRYRIGYQVDERPRQPLTVACDGSRLLKLYHNRVVTSPARRLPPELARLIDPAWLLSGWRLSAAGQHIVGGRAAFLVTAELLAEPRERPVIAPAPAMRIAAMIDAETGILLRQVSYVDDEPAVRFELRNVTRHLSAAPEDFGVDVPPEVPRIESDGDEVHDLDLPVPVRAAGEAAAAVLDGARSAWDRLSAQARRMREEASGR